MNHHGLSDFRSAHPELLEQLLIENVAALSVAGVIDLDEVVQDGVRVRASAGSLRYRRKKKLDKELKKAKRLVERLKAESEDDPDASNRRIQAARERAASERAARVKAALGQLAAVEAHRARRGRANRNNKKKGSKPEPRASTTDPEARVMKMADGGFRPAYNCQIASVAQGQIAIAVSVETVGSDHGLMRPMLEASSSATIACRSGIWSTAASTTTRRSNGRRQHDVKVYGPPPTTSTRPIPIAAQRRRSRRRRLAQRMRARTARGVYKRRAPGECINARLRNGASASSMSAAAKKSAPCSPGSRSPTTSWPATG